MAPRLKVFVTSDGLTDYVVATTSKTKALAAWGSHQDLFKTGLAHEADDPALVQAATAQPDEVLRRPAGSRGELAKLKSPKPKKAPAPSKAAMKKVADLKTRISAAEAAHAKALQEIERKRLDLERQQSELDAKHATMLGRLKEQLSAAERALGS